MQQQQQQQQQQRNRPHIFPVEYRKPSPSGSSPWKRCKAPCRLTVTVETGRRLRYEISSNGKTYEQGWLNGSLIDMKTAGLNAVLQRTTMRVVTSPTDGSSSSSFCGARTQSCAVLAATACTADGGSRCVACSDIHSHGLSSRPGNHDASRSENQSVPSRGCTQNSEQKEGTSERWRQDSGQAPASIDYRACPAPPPPPTKRKQKQKPTPCNFS